MRIHIFSQLDNFINSYAHYAKGTLKIMLLLLFIIVKFLIYFCSFTVLFSLLIRSNIKIYFNIEVGLVVETTYYLISVFPTLALCY